MPNRTWPFFVGSVGICAALMTASAFFNKTTRTGGMNDWVDSFRLWTAISIVSGGLILVALVTAEVSGYHAIAPLVAIPLFMLSGFTTGDYRLELVDSFNAQDVYTQQTVDAGLYVVPWAATAGTISAIILAVILIEQSDISWPVSRYWGPAGGGG